MDDITMQKDNDGKGRDTMNKGMYDAAFEHDACGMGFVADVKGRKSRSIID